MTNQTLEEVANSFIDLDLTSSSLGEFFEDPTAPIGEKAVPIIQEIEGFYKKIFQKDNPLDYLKQGKLGEVLTPLGKTIFNGLSEMRAIKKYAEKASQLPPKEKNMLGLRYLYDRITMLESAKLNVSSPEKLNDEIKEKLSSFFYSVSDISNKAYERYRPKQNDKPKNK